MCPEARYTDGMPPAPDRRPDTSIDVSHLLPEHTKTKQRSGAGPIIGVFIIVALLTFGGLYFWGAKLNAEQSDTLPLIPGDTSAL